MTTTCCVCGEAFPPGKYFTHPVPGKMPASRGNVYTCHATACKAAARTDTARYAANGQGDGGEKEARKGKR